MNRFKHGWFFGVAMSWMVMAIVIFIMTEDLYLWPR